jgi:hypothetical protein
MSGPRWRQDVVSQHNDPRDRADDAGRKSVIVDVSLSVCRRCARYSTYCNDATTKSFGSFTPVAWFGQ